MFDDLLAYLGNFFFIIGNIVMGFTLVIGLVFGILLGLETKFGFLDTSAYTLVRLSKKLGLFALIGIVAGILFYILGLVITPNQMSL
ncbi:MULTISPECIES: hypothetical protein [Mammaliicoccus]|uniref:hypothetical protein n=1 Tax=Mammaliicoccus TaxID=2803850 RepID=UPI001EFBDF7C|nr:MULTISPECIES: hypothetical protein [Mammaliicoccus]